MTLTTVHACSTPVWLRSPWLPFGALVFGAWVLLFRHRQVMGTGSMAMPASGSPDAVLTQGGLWALMAVAMMAPTAVPVLASLRAITARSSVRPWWAFLGGYLAVWLVFAVMATALQLAVAHVGLLDAAGRSTDRWLTGGLLLAAGAYQFSALKRHCVTACATPMTFFLRHWRDGTTGGLRMGLRSGLTCLGCCWALMLLAFVGGVHALAFMALGALIMVVEKLPGLARLVTVPLGLALVGAGLAALLGLAPAALTAARTPPHPHDDMGAARTEHLPWNPGHSTAS